MRTDSTDSTGSTDGEILQCAREHHNVQLDMPQPGFEGGAVVAYENLELAGAAAAVCRMHGRTRRRPERSPMAPYINL